MSTSKGYAGKRQATVRTRVAAMLPAPCYRCGRVVTAEMNWHADHTISRAEAKVMGMSEVEVDQMVAPAHASCNTRAGAQLKNRMHGGGKSQAPKKIARVARPKMASESSFSDDHQNPAPLPHTFSPRPEGGESE